MPRVGKKLAFSPTNQFAGFIGGCLSKVRRKATAARSANLIWLSSPKEKRGKRQPWHAADASSGRGNVRVNFSANLLNVIAASVPQSESTPNLARFYDGNPIRRQSWFPAAPLAYIPHSVSDREQTTSGLLSFFLFFNLRHRPFYCANTAQRRAIYARKRHEEKTLMRLMNMWERTCYTPMDDLIILGVMFVTLLTSSPCIRRTRGCWFFPCAESADCLARAWGRDARP